MRTMDRRKFLKNTLGLAILGLCPLDSYSEKTSAYDAYYKYAKPGGKDNRSKYLDKIKKAFELDNFVDIKYFDKPNNMMGTIFEKVFGESYIDKLEKELEEYTTLITLPTIVDHKEEKIVIMRPENE